MCVCMFMRVRVGVRVCGRKGREACFDGVTVVFQRVTAQDDSKTRLAYLNGF